MYRMRHRIIFFAARFWGLLCGPRVGILCGAASPSPDDVPYVF